MNLFDLTTPPRHDRSATGRTSATVRRAGFTLPELAVAVAVFGILLSVAVPSFSDAVAESRLKDIQRSLAATLRVARAESGMRRERVVVCARASSTECGDDWSDGWIAFVDAAGGSPLALDPGETVLRLRGPEQDERVSIVATRRAPWSTQTLPASAVGTEPRMRGDTALFVLCDRRGVDRARAVVRDPAGSVRTALGRNAAGERLGPWNEPLGCPT